MAEMQAKSSHGFVHELQTMARRGREVWGLIPFANRMALGGAVLVMAVASAANTAIALHLGTLVNAVNNQVNAGHSRSAVWHVAAVYLGLIGLAYLVREATNV